MPQRKALPHVNAAAHAKVMARLRRATPEERVQSLIRAGILTKWGSSQLPIASLSHYPKSIEPKYRRVDISHEVLDRALPRERLGVGRRRAWTRDAGVSRGRMLPEVGGSRLLT